MQTADIGLIGLGTMGSNLALNIAEKGFRIAVFNRTVEHMRTFVDSAGPLSENLVPCETLADLVRAIRRPCPVILMVPAGAPVDEQIAALQPLLGADDMIIDAGNANFRDTRRRMAALSKTGPHFIGMGVSGGEEGARHGPSIMVGGPRQAYTRIAPVLEAISARYEGESCQAWLGPDGAGHFVKTIHNGIEYADMQMIAEIYGILRDGHGLSAKQIAPIFKRWNEGRLNSYLIEITSSVLEADDPKTGNPMVDMILDRAGQKGTGRWSVIEAQELGVSATVMEAAVAARSLSSLKEQRLAAEKRFGVPVTGLGKPDEADIARLEAALLAGKVIAYAQGFMVLSAASAEFGWELPLATIARIWRAGCIIRSQFLDDIAHAFEAAAGISDLTETPAFSAILQEKHPALRKIVADSVGNALPVPALSAALAYFDMMRRGYGTANLIQGQRDFFGNHGFERIDEAGAHHGEWAGA